jgi:hypothetical protein
MEKSPLFKILVQNHNRKYKKCRFLAIITGSSISISITYIVFVTEMQKGKPGEMSLPLWKTISQILNRFQKSRYIADIQRFG